ncbi:MAG TPA: DUF3187 family protein [Steroidobacteraceae bacterium]|jgi:hypothetical protein|nr:DUF3187 family protein [Steroidobacteraceae bacterium]
MKVSRLLRAAACCAFALPAVAAADEGGFYGLLRSRDLSPFGFLRLDMRPAHAVAIEPGTWALETEIGYQNTWALSPEVEKYLTGLEPTGRRRLGPAEVQAIRDLPGENYLLDLEVGTIDFTAHYKISRHWAAYAILSAISYQGGFLDNTIENFHQAAGFSTFGRPAVQRNHATLIYDLKGAQITLLDRPTDGGLLDPTLGVRYSGLQFSDRWRLVLEGAVKVPLRGERLLVSTGRTDWGVQAALQRTGTRHGFFVDAAAVYYAGASEPARNDSQVIPTLLVGYEFRWTERTNLNIQAYASKSVYNHNQTDLEDLTGAKYQYSVGLRHRFDPWLVTFGFTENVQNINNTPDIGFQLGLAWLPSRLH